MTVGWRMIEVVNILVYEYWNWSSLVLSLIVIFLVRVTHSVKVLIAALPFQLHTGSGQPACEGVVWRAKKTLPVCVGVVGR